MARALLINYQNWLSAARLPHLLTMAQWQVSVFTPRNRHMRYSRYAERKILGSKDLLAFASEANHYIAQHESEYDMIMLCDDKIISYVIEHCSSSDPLHTALPIQTPKHIAETILTDKSAFHSHAPDLGLPVPDSITCHDWSETRSALEKIGYPAIIKPLKGSSGIGVQKIASEDDLQHYIDRESSLPVLLQQYITGDVGLTEVFCHKGDCRVILHSTKNKVEPASFGHSTSRVFEVNEQAESLALSLFKTLQFTGFGGFDWIREEHTGKLYVIEMHARQTSGWHLAALMDNRILDLLKLQSTPQDTSYTPKITASDPIPLFPEDAVRCFKHLRLGEFLSSFSSPLWRKTLPFHDLPLFMSYIKFIVRSSLRALIGRR